MYVSVRGVSIPVGTLLRILLGIFDLALLYYFLALYHTASAVLAAVLALFTGRTAARAVVVVFDLGSYDLFLGGFVGTEAQASCDPLYECDQDHERCGHRCQCQAHDDEPEYDI